jgi:hypothetical protein
MTKKNNLINNKRNSPMILLDNPTASTNSPIVINSNNDEFLIDDILAAKRSLAGRNSPMVINNSNNKHNGFTITLDKPVISNNNHTTDDSELPNNDYKIYMVTNTFTNKSYIGYTQKFILEDNFYNARRKTINKIVDYDDKAIDKFKAKVDKDIVYTIINYNEYDLSTIYSFTILQRIRYNMPKNFVTDRKNFYIVYYKTWIDGLNESMSIINSNNYTIVIDTIKECIAKGISINKLSILTNLSTDVLYAIINNITYDSSIPIPYDIR